jgi:hypothetical protein
MFSRFGSRPGTSGAGALVIVAGFIPRGIFTRSGNAGA